MIILDPFTINVMLDFETLDTEPTALPVSLGAIEIIPDLDKAKRFQVNFNVQELIETEEFSISADTLKWWMNQSYAVREAAIPSNKEASLSLAVTSFTSWAASLGEKPIVLWANWASFDFPILRRIYKQIKEPFPFSRRNLRCYGTIKKLFPDISPDRELDLIKHIALEDAIYQAKHLLKIARQVSKNG